MYIKSRFLVVLLLLQTMMVGCASVYGDGKSMRKMTFVWEGKEEEQKYKDEKLEVKIEYEDPIDVSIRFRDLEGSQVLPFRFEVKNISKQKIYFTQNDITLDIGVPLNPEPVDNVIKTIQESGKLPAFFDKIAGSLPRSVLPIRTRNQRVLSKVADHIIKKGFMDGEIKSGKKREGLIFFMLPAEPPDIHTTILRSPNRDPQIIEVKGIDVKTNTDDKSFGNWFVKVWRKYIRGTSQPFGKSYAIVVGISNYDHKDLKDLESPASDVNKMVEFLHEHQKFDEVIYITDREVTRARLKDPETELKNYIHDRIKENDRFLFYYSGHGVTHQAEACGYLPLAAAKGNYKSKDWIPGDDWIAMNELVNWMDNLKCKHLMVILDCCFSGLAIRNAEIEEKSPRYTPKINADLLKRYSTLTARYLVMAGDEGQKSIANKKYWGGSLFTDAFIEGAKKKADSSKDEIVTYDELRAWLKPVVSNAANEVDKILMPQFKDLGLFGASKGQFFFLKK